MVAVVSHTEFISNNNTKPFTQGLEFILQSMEYTQLIYMDYVCKNINMDYVFCYILLKAIQNAGI